MVKPQGNNGFTLIESVLTLAVVSTVVLVMMSHIHIHHNYQTDDEIENMQYFFQNAQTSAIKSGERKVIFAYMTDHQLMIVDSDGKIDEVMTLEICRIRPNSLTRFSYLPNGDTNAFGTIRFDCDNRMVNFIFQIQKGRFRIEG